jgi:hypothetical protein
MRLAIDACFVEEVAAAAGMMRWQLLRRLGAHLIDSLANARLTTKGRKKGNTAIA